jgi:hypothetical protein
MNSNQNTFFGHSEDHLKHTAFVLDHALNSAILMFSYCMGITNEEAITKIIGCLESKVKTKALILCGAGRLSDVMSQVHGSFDGEAVAGVLKIHRQESIEKLTSELSRTDAGREAIANEIPFSGPSSLKDFKSVESTTGTLKLMMGPDTSEEEEFINQQFSETFKTADIDTFNAVKEKAGEKLLRIEPTMFGPDIKSTTASIKFNSMSIGMHERLCGSKKLTKEQAQASSKVNEVSKYMMKDAMYCGRNGVPEEVIDEFNREVLGKRPKIIQENFADDIGLGSKSPKKFIRQETVVYFKDDVNGRPDAILFDKKGNPFGVVEFKSCTSDATATNNTTGLKQTALYQNLLQAKEAYLCCYPAKSAKFAMKIFHVPKTTLDAAARDLECMKHNFAWFRDYLEPRIKK